MPSLPHHLAPSPNSAREAQRGWPTLLLLLVCCIGLAPSPATGTVYVAMNDSRLADGASLIVDGRVLEVSPWGDGGRPQTRYTLTVDEVLKGTWDLPSIAVDLPGGRGTNGTLWSVAGTPQWQPGDRILVFLSPTHDGRWTLEQFFLGGFAVTLEEDAWTARRDLSDGHALHLPTTHSTLDGPRDFVAFSQWLRDRGQGIWRQPDYFLPPGNAEAKSNPVKFANLQSSPEPWPMGCGDTGGHGLRWFDFEAGGNVPWRSYFSGQVGIPGRGFEEMQQALLAWEQTPGTFVDLTYQGITSSNSGFRLNDGVNAALFEDPFDEIGGTWQGSGVLALGGPWFSCTLKEYQGNSFHPILEADIVTQDGLSDFFQGLANPNAAAEELFGHEIGHTLGLAHSDEADSLMAPHLHNDGRGASVSADDVAAMLYLYGVDNNEPTPAQPQSLQADLISGLRVHLSWLDFADNETGFRIERRRLDEPYRVVGSTPTNVIEWTDENLRPDTEYTYRIRAHNSGGPSAASNAVVLNTPAGNSPQGPTLLRAAPLTDERVRLTWQDNAADETNFVLEILFPGNDAWLRAPFLLQPNSTAVNLAGLDPGQRYGFRVLARNNFGVSPTSNAARVATIPTATPCRVDSESLCLLNGRFRIEAEFVDPADGQTRTASAIPSTDHTGFFWFFQPGNFELVIKMIDGREINESFWLFYGGITDLEFRIQVTDTATGQTRTYRNPAGEICGRADTAAFPQLGGHADGHDLEGLRPPPSNDETLDEAIQRVLSQLSLEALDPSELASAPDPTLEADSVTSDTDDQTQHDTATQNTAVSDKTLGVTPCRADATTLCLLNGRLQVEVEYRDPHDNNREGIGQAVQGTAQSGQFWFFQLESSELVVKAIDGTNANGNLWLFFGSLTDVSYSLKVTDTLTASQKIYYNPPGQLCGQVDLEAFVGLQSGPTP